MAMSGSCPECGAAKGLMRVDRETFTIEHRGASATVQDSPAGSAGFAATSFSMPKVRSSMPLPVTSS
jgi:hypothetical protein